MNRYGSRSFLVDLFVELILVEKHSCVEVVEASLVALSFLAGHLSFIVLEADPVAHERQICSIFNLLECLDIVDVRLAVKARSNGLVESRVCELFHTSARY